MCKLKGRENQFLIQIVLGTRDCLSEWPHSVETNGTFVRWDKNPLRMVKILRQKSLANQTCTAVEKCQSYHERSENVKHFCRAANIPR